MRAGIAILAAVGAALLLGSPAHAAAVVKISSPSDGAVLTTPTAITVVVDRAAFDPAPTVEVRLSLDGVTEVSGTEIVTLACQEPSGCEPGAPRQEAWGGVRLDPAGARPFRSSGAACNGGYYLQARADGGEWAATHVIVLSERRVDPPGEVTASHADGVVRLRWTPALQPDASYRIERRPVGAAAWTEVMTLPAGSSTASDRPSAGEWDYRVVALRGDGLQDGQPVRACTDYEPDLTAASPARTVTVTAAAGAAADPGATPQDGQRVAAPPAAERDTRRAAAPRIPTVTPPAAAGVGADGGFEQELPYDGVTPVVASPTATDEATELGEVVAGGAGTTLDVDLDRRRILVSVAGGLLLVTVALHLRRWLKVAS